MEVHIYTAFVARLFGRVKSTPHSAADTHLNSRL